MPNDPKFAGERGAGTLEFLNRRGEYADVPRPDLVLLDWSLSAHSGEEVLEEIQSDSALEDTPVVVLTGSEAEEDIVTSHNNGANAYVTKPVDPDAFIEVVRSLENFRLSVVRLPPSIDEE